MVDSEEEIETVEEYREFWDAEADKNPSRFGDYAAGKVELADDVIEGAPAPQVVAEANERYENAKPQTVESARAKGAIDAVDELGELGELDADADPAESEDEDAGGEKIGEVPFNPADHTVSEIRDRVKEIDDADVLVGLAELERTENDEPRSTAIDAIEERAEEVRADELPPGVEPTTEENVGEN